MDIRGWQIWNRAIPPAGGTGPTVTSAGQALGYGSCERGLISDYPRGGVCDI